ncbi:hypothetical protein J7E81_04385 [Bacillus sp. ISL-18]|uniref:hypothetical protein n=1 Tax=Bacillus sp. ISL-18 TaxID=2819118 RepID=UPI001BE66161|nr:hypothetical protein [Bacillus sp. ISL-18]MBT2654486.1 hypothetical protein [Bacillus sp. ISL-18]
MTKVPTSGNEEVTNSVVEPTVAVVEENSTSSVQATLLTLLKNPEKSNDEWYR